MVEMQVRVDDPADVLGAVSQRFERVRQPGAAVRSEVVDAVDLTELGVVLVADARVHEHQTVVVLHEEAAEGQRDPVLRIGGDAPLPQRLWHDPEHRPAVEVLEARFQQMATQAAD
jgi:hypothetical protein